VIKTRANGASRRLYDTGRSRFGGLDHEAAVELLGALDEAISPSEASPLKSVGLHKLKGNRHGQWAMTVNGP